MSYARKEIKRLVGKAIHRHQMICDGDHVLVAVSGGSDSLSLLWFLRDRMRRIPIRYRITAVHVDPGFEGDSANRVAAFLKGEGFDYRIIRSRIGPLAHSTENRENPCFLCARLRRKILFEEARKLGCRLLALGHNKDDLIETFFLYVLYGASLSTMLPMQPFFDGRLTVIRPLYLVEENTIRRFTKSMDWPEISLGCPTSGTSRREDIKSMLSRFYRSNKKIKGNIFHALHNVKPEYLPHSIKS